MIVWWFVIVAAAALLVGAAIGYYAAAADLEAEREKVAKKARADGFEAGIEAAWGLIGPEARLAYQRTEGQMKPPMTLAEIEACLAHIGVRVGAVGTTTERARAILADDEQAGGVR